MSKLLLACLLLLFALGLPTVARAAECTEITTAAYTISAPGHYCLGADIASGQTGVTIAASHVDLDCRGYSLRSTNVNTAQNTYGVYINNQTDVHVHHCHISGGHAAGIYAYQDNGLANQNKNMTFDDNTVAGTFWYGILAYGTGIDIHDNHIQDIGGRASFAMGIRVGGSTLSGQKRAFVVRDNVIRDVVSPANHGYGIYANNANDSTFAGNVISGTDSPDLYSDFAIKVAQGGANKITGNQVHGSNNINAVGIVGTAGDACFDNFIRGMNDLTVGCDASLGNF